MDTFNMNKNVSCKICLGQIFHKRISVQKIIKSIIVYYNIYSKELN